jgi:UDP-glucose 4-epimerase
VSRPTVLVLGAGFIGAAVARALLEQGCAVAVLTRTEPDARRRTELAGASVVVGDATETATLASALRGVNEVVYAVGASSPVESDLDPAGDVAVVVPPLIRLLELLRGRRHVRLMFFSSGGAVYGNQLRLPVPESAPARPISSYGIIKLTCEQYIGMYAGAYGLSATILRVGNAYGPFQPVSRGQGVIARLVRSAVTGEVIPMFGLDGAIRDYIFIDDVAHVAARLVCRRERPRLLNLGTGVGYPLRDVLALVRAVSGRTIPARPVERRSFDVTASVLDVTALRSLMPFSPIGLRAGVERTWAHVADHAHPAVTVDHLHTAPGFAPSAAEPLR